jgi:toxin ParE1/3/4
MLKIARKAVADLDDIAGWGARTFGPIQSEKYERRLVLMLDAIAANPEMAPERQASRRTVRLMPCEAHHILYLISDGDVIIVRVLHHLQDWFELV